MDLVAESFGQRILEALRGGVERDVLHELADADGINFAFRRGGRGSGLFGGRGSGLFGGRGRRCASAGGEGEYHRQREKKDKCFFHGV